VQHLKLNKFKGFPCVMESFHKSKQCEFYHSQTDHRRIDRVYSADICKQHESQVCAMAEACPMAHSNVERLYHVEKYKTKYCATPPDECPYDDFCSFAHSNLDIKTRLIHMYERDSEFYMFYFKTEWCPF